MNRRHFQFGLLVLSSSVGFFFMLSLVDRLVSIEQIIIQQSPSIFVPKKKMILFWNSFFSEPFYYFGEGQEPFVSSKCPQVNCYTSANRGLIPLEDWDAIVFHGVSVDFQDVPKRRSASQKYVFFMLESPGSRSNEYLKPLHNFFNWTTTYRSDSDIYFPYAHIQSKSSGNQVDPGVKNWVPEIPYEGPNVASRKSRMAAIFVSNCYTNGKREVLVRELSRYIQVHVYGACGNMSCPRSDDVKCWDMLNKHYKFYLAFENSLCRDYVTEKFFNAMGIDIVPVVYGGADYSSVAPPNSYIDVRSFPTVKNLGEYLALLDQNDAMYNQYFWWKKYYRVGSSTFPSCFCRMCQMLHENVDSRVYKDIHDWWVGPGNCTRGLNIAL